MSTLVWKAFRFSCSTSSAISCSISVFYFAIIVYAVVFTLVRLQNYSHQIFRGPMTFVKEVMYQHMYYTNSNIIPEWDVDSKWWDTWSDCAFLLCCNHVCDNESEFSSYLSDWLFHSSRSYLYSLICICIRFYAYTAFHTKPDNRKHHTHKK